MASTTGPATTSLIPLRTDYLPVVFPFLTQYSVLVDHRRSHWRVSFSKTYSTVSCLIIAWGRIRRIILSWIRHNLGQAEALAHDCSRFGPSSFPSTREWRFTTGLVSRAWCSAPTFCNFRSCIGMPAQLGEGLKQISTSIDPVGVANAFFKISDT